MGKAVIFDMDGVIIDSQPLYFLADQMILEKFGKKVDLAFVKSYAGIANLERYKKYREELSMEADPSVMSQALVQTFEKMLDKEGVHTPEGVISLIENLCKLDIKMAVASSSPYDLILRVLALFNIREYFEVIVSGEQVKASKPAPDVFITAAEKLGVNTMDCVVIEDSAMGVTAAKRAGMKCIGYYNKNSGEQDLSSADRMIYSFKELNEDFLWL